MKIVSLNTGKRTEVQWRGKTYATGIFKSKIEGLLFLDVEDVQNDAVIDRKHHGGIDKAVYAYGYNHYAYWRSLYPSLNLQYGFMGENLTVSNLEENDIHLGEIAIGDEFQLIEKSMNSPSIAEVFTAKKG